MHGIIRGALAYSPSLSMTRSYAHPLLECDTHNAGNAIGRTHGDSVWRTNDSDVSRVNFMMLAIDISRAL